jgi:hypothetical protein
MMMARKGDRNMHSRWSLTGAPPRFRAPLPRTCSRFRAPLLRAPIRVGPVRLAPGGLAPLLRAPVRLAAIVAAMTAVTALAAGCGHQGATTASKKAPLVRCGTTRTAANVPVRIEVRQGQVSCSAAMAVERSYAKAIAEGKEPGNGGGGPVTISGWKCQGFPTPKVLSTGWASRCVRGGSEILAVLPPPS